MIEESNIVWSLLAYDAYQSIGDEILKRFGYKAKIDYENEVDETVKLLAEFPNQGKPEFELAEDGSVRSMTVRKLSKIIYYEEDGILHIADFWATRQDPNFLKERFEK